MCQASFHVLLCLELLGHLSGQSNTLLELHRATLGSLESSMPGFPATSCFLPAASLSSLKEGHLMRLDQPDFLDAQRSEH